MLPGLLIISVYRPDLYENALRAVGVASDVTVVLDRRVGERRRRARVGEGSFNSERRSRIVADQLRADGWAWIPGKDRRSPINF
jgi:hypothetical protein